MALPGYTMAAPLQGFTLGFGGAGLKLNLGKPSKLKTLFIYALGFSVPEKL